MGVNKVVYGSTTLIDLSSDTVASASDIVSGKIGHLRDGTQVTGTASGGGSSSWTKVAETTYNVSTTSTSTQTVATWSTGNSSIWTANSYVLIRIRDTAGARAGYFYGSDTFVVNQVLASGLTTTSLSVGTRCTYRYNSLSQYSTATTAYGVYPDYIYSDGRIRIRSRYNSSSSLTINGTFSVAVYLLTPPSAIFE